MDRVTWSFLFTVTEQLRKISVKRTRNLTVSDPVYLHKRKRSSELRKAKPCLRAILSLHELLERDVIFQDHLKVVFMQALMKHISTCQNMLMTCPTV